MFGTKVLFGENLFNDSKDNIEKKAKILLKAEILEKLEGRKQKSEI